MEVPGHSELDAIVGTIRSRSHPIIGARSDLDPLMEMIGSKSIVLLGEATHGTHEFYTARAEITKRLVEEKGFSAIVIEADWPDAQRVNHFVQGKDISNDPTEALTSFRRFPMWMWRNSAFLDLVKWLWLHNGRESTLNRVGVYGMDLYSLYSSIEAVIEFLDRADPQAAARARSLYSCFDHPHKDPIRYGRHVRIGARRSCEEDAKEIAENAFSSHLVAKSIDVDPDEVFFARQNAELVRSAERYYRNLFSPLINTWNVRDTHMADTVDRLIEHLREQGRPEGVVIWAHNSHIGDDRATEMGWHGQLNIGQLMRERHPKETFHIGFTTYEGSVTAAEEWDAPPSIENVRPALAGSYETFFHLTGLGDFLLDLKNPKVVARLSEPRLERAIGVVYSPQTERASHYFLARIVDQFDAILHYDVTRAVEPIDRLAKSASGQPSEIQL